jgi:hypothetical protein
MDYAKKYLQERINVLNWSIERDAHLFLPNGKFKGPRDYLTLILEYKKQRESLIKALKILNEGKE